MPQDVVQIMSVQSIQVPDKRSRQNDFKNPRVQRALNGPSKRQDPSSSFGDLRAVGSEAMTRLHRAPQKASLEEGSPKLHLPHGCERRGKELQRYKQASGGKGQFWGSGSWYPSTALEGS